MANDSRMTVRLDAATRRKVERLAAREGISLNAALNRLLQAAGESGPKGTKKKRYRLRPRRVGFGFDIADAKVLAREMADQETVEKVKGRA